MGVGGGSNGKVMAVEAIEAIEVVVELLDYCVQPRGGTVGRSIIGGGVTGVKTADGSVGGSKGSWFQRWERVTVVGLARGVS